MIVVADASPLQYLVLIEHVDVLPSLFGTIGVPPAVLSELSHPVAPEADQRFLRSQFVILETAGDELSDHVDTRLEPVTSPVTPAA